MKRSTPVGEEQPDMTPSEESPEKHDVQKDVKRDSTKISRSNNE